LSSIYHDIGQDRLYTDAANSSRRRSTQTALWRMARGLCAMLSPILAFTADEAWEFIPENGAESVHLATWSRGFSHWTRTRNIRGAASLTCARRCCPIWKKRVKQKTIGKALEARVALAGPAPLLPSTEPDSAALRELLNVSQLSIEIRESPSLSVEVSPAAGEKCERCWHFETDVGSDPSHPTICAVAVAALQEK